MKKWTVGFYILVLVLALAGCTKSEKASLLNPDKPITVTVWHYYNGGAKEAFDNLVTQFNETVGMEQGIVVDAQSQGSVNQLADAVFDAANESIGASPLPHIFASYADNAIRVHQIVPLVPLTEYFTDEDLSQYRQEFLEEGRFITDNEYYIVPIAKSSENLYVNKTFWTPFAEKYGYTEGDLSTWEGVYAVSKAYYEETGKGFFSIDAVANFVIVSSMQLGEELYTYSEDGTAEFEMSETLKDYIWTYYYKPSIKGYYKKSGRFSSDDAKIGNVVSYTGSTAGAAYFPTVVALSDVESYNIDPLVLPYPYFEGRDKVSIQQGAGMCITQSDEAHEYAGALFLKWFTSKDQNLTFAVSTGYFPVMQASLDEAEMIAEAEKRDVKNSAIKESIKASNIMFNDYELYNSKAFKGSYEMRVLLDTHLLNKINSDLLEIEQLLESGQSHDEIMAVYFSDEAMQTWYSNLKYEADLILSNTGKE
jgi:multiple sugar transport system substrate-binding protein